MPSSRSLLRILALIAGMAILAGCNSQYASNMRAYTPIPPELLKEMAAKGMTPSSPILVRVYKQESELELWKQTSSGRYALLKTYPICRWSGQLGPKKTEGDRQVPEGFYSVTPSQMNPNSRYYLSYDIGFPNALDRSLGRTGGNIMVHGVCSSRGCFAMTNEQMAEIYAVTREALAGGEKSFQFQSFPFRMTAENMAKNRRNPNIAFWQNLKEGSDNFEVTKQPVEVAACGGRYVFNGQGGARCGLPPGNAAVAAAVAQKEQQDDAKVAALVNAGTKAVAYLYEDGGENEFFRERAVSSQAIPGIDIPYSTVSEPTVVALNDSGRPATVADATAADKATYSAAETLLMSEAAVAHRQTGPAAPAAVMKRQSAVYASLMGSKMQPQAGAAATAAPAAVAERPARAETVRSAPGTAPVLVPGAVQLASAGNAPVQADGQPFYLRMLSFTGLSSGAAQQQPSAPIVGTSGAAVQKPFYKRWLGLGAEDQPAAAETPAPVAAPALAASTKLLLPPRKPHARAAGPAKARVVADGQ